MEELIPYPPVPSTEEIEAVLGDQASEEAPAQMGLEGTNGSQGLRTGPVNEVQATSGDAESEETGEESSSNDSIDLDQVDDLSSILGL